MPWDTKVISVILAAVNRSVTRTFQSYVFQAALKRKVKSYLTELPVFIHMTRCTVGAPAFPVQVANCFQNAVEIRLLEKAEMNQYEDLSNKVIIGRKAKMEDEIQPKKKDSVRTPHPSTDTSDDQKTNQKPCGIVTALDKSNSFHYQIFHHNEKADSNKPAATTAFKLLSRTNQIISGLSLRSWI